MLNDVSACSPRGWKLPFESAATPGDVSVNNELSALLTLSLGMKRTGIVGGPIPREDVAHGTTIEVFHGDILLLSGLRRGSLEAVEFATLEWVDWFNHRRLLEPIGYVPPAEYEARYYEQAAVA
jgi:transposase InsO family protein